MITISDQSFNYDPATIERENIVLNLTFNVGYDNSHLGNKLNFDFQVWEDDPEISTSRSLPVLSYEPRFGPEDNRVTRPLAWVKTIVLNRTSLLGRNRQTISTFLSISRDALNKDPIGEIDDPLSAASAGGFPPRRRASVDEIFIRIVAKEIIVQETESTGTITAQTKVKQININ